MWVHDTGNEFAIQDKGGFMSMVMYTRINTFHLRKSTWQINLASIMNEVGFFWEIALEVLLHGISWSVLHYMTAK